MFRRLLPLLTLLLIPACGVSAFDSTAYLPYYRLEPVPGAENALGRPGFDAAPDAWDGRIISDTVRALPARWDDASWRTRLIRDYDHFILHFPPVDEETGESLPTRNQVSFLKSLKYGHPESTVRLSLLGHSSDFMPLVGEEEALDRFVSYLTALCSDYGLDGIDLDWEFQAAPRDREDKAITALAAALADTLPKQSVLSAAVSRWRLPSREFFASLDRVHIMAYDGYARHSTYEGALADTEVVISRTGIDRDQVVLGIPFYGRIYDDESEEYFTGTMNYREIMEEFDPPPGDDEAGGYFFNGMDTVVRKTEWAMENGLAGVFIWEPFYDVSGTGSLASAIRAAISGKVSGS